MPVDGTFPTGTAKFEKRSIAAEIPIWDPTICIDCGLCFTGLSALRDSDEGISGRRSDRRTRQLSLQALARTRICPATLDDPGCA